MNQVRVCTLDQAGKTGIQPNPNDNMLNLDCANPNLLLGLAQDYCTRYYIQIENS